MKKIQKNTIALMMTVAVILGCFTGIAIGFAEEIPVSYTYNKDASCLAVAENEFLLEFANEQDEEIQGLRVLSLETGEFCDEEPEITPVDDSGRKFSIKYSAVSGENVGGEYALIFEDNTAVIASRVINDVLKRRNEFSDDFDSYATDNGAGWNTELDWVTKTQKITPFQTYVGSSISYPWPAKAWVNEGRMQIDLTSQHVNAGNMVGFNVLTDETLYSENKLVVEFDMSAIKIVDEAEGEKRSYFEVLGVTEENSGAKNDRTGAYPLFRIDGEDIIYFTDNTVSSGFSQTAVTDCPLKVSQNLDEFHHYKLVIDFKNNVMSLCQDDIQAFTTNVPEIFKGTTGGHKLKMLRFANTKGVTVAGTPDIGAVSERFDNLVIDYEYGEKVLGVDKVLFGQKTDEGETEYTSSLNVVDYNANEIKVIFTKEINAQTLDNIVILDSEGNEVLTVAEAMVDEPKVCILTFDENQMLLPASKYFVVVKTGLMDLNDASFVREYKQSFTTAASSEEILENLKDAASDNVAKVYDVLTAKYPDYYNLTGFEALGLDTSGIEDLEHASVIYGEMIKKAGDEFQTSGPGVVLKAQSFWLRSVEVQKLNEGKCENIFPALEDMFNYNDESISGFYDLEFVRNTEFQENVTKKVSERGIDSEEEFFEHLEEAFFLAACEIEGNTAAIKDIIAHLGNEGKIDVKTNNVKEKVYQKIPSYSYDSYNELEEKFTDLVNSDKSSGSVGGSGSGGSGGRKNNVISGITSYESSVVPKSEPVEDMHVFAFNDLDSVEWAQTAISALATKGVLRGKTEGMFYPNDHVTREEFAKMVVEALEIQAENGEMNFSDVQTGAWYYDYVLKAKTSGVVNGIGDGLFGTGEKITRQDLVVMAYRAAKNSGTVFLEYDGKFKFSDDAQIADYAKEAVYTLRANEVINGIDKKTFAPNAFATRAEAAKILYLLIEL